MYSVFRRASFRSDRLTLSFRGIFSIGIMQRRRGIPERLYSVRRSRFLYHTDWGLRSMTMRAV